MDKELSYNPDIFMTNLWQILSDRWCDLREAAEKCNVDPKDPYCRCIEAIDNVKAKKATEDEENLVRKICSVSKRLLSENVDQASYLNIKDFYMDYPDNVDIELVRKSFLKLCQSLIFEVEEAIKNHVAEGSKAEMILKKIKSEAKSVVNYINIHDSSVLKSSYIQLITPFYEISPEDVCIFITRFNRIYELNFMIQDLFRLHSSIFKD